MKPLSLISRVAFPLLLLSGCQPDDLVAPSFSKGGLPPAESARALTVFSQNVYVGTDVDAVLSAPADQLPAAIGQALATFMATDWPARADAFAAKIVATNADVVALNEVTTLTVAGLTPFLPEIYVEFLPILMQRIADHGGNYVVAGQVANTDANLTVGPGQVRLQDFDVMLVRSDRPHTTIAQQQFAARAPVDFGSLGAFALIRGFVAVDVMLQGNPVRVVATHLEPVETAPILQSAQAAELIAWLDAAAVPVIIAGDLNSTPTDPSPASPYQQFAAAGFRDSWLERTGPKSDPGLTCCHAGDLVNAESGMVKRIDYVLIRNTTPGHGATTVGRFGAVQSDRLPNGLWPSDHAGILARVMFPGIGGTP